MAIAEHYGYVRMNDIDAQIKVYGSKFARGLSKLLNVHIDTVLWLEEHQIQKRLGTLNSTIMIRWNTMVYSEQSIVF